RGLAVAHISYGHYTPQDYIALLRNSKSMLYLSCHESQGFAYQECLACNVPVIAWNQGFWLDIERFTYGREFVPASSVPFFDHRCGEQFSDFKAFVQMFDNFYLKACRGSFQPRDFVLQNLTIENSTRRMMNIYDSI